MSSRDKEVADFKARVEALIKRYDSPARLAGEVCNYLWGKELEDYVEHAREGSPVEEHILVLLAALEVSLDPETMQASLDSVGDMVTTFEEHDEVGEDDLVEETRLECVTPGCTMNHYQCQDCRDKWHQGQLNEVEDLAERVSEGERVPDGQCPGCGAVCHLVGATSAPGAPSPGCRPGPS